MYQSNDTFFTTFIIGKVTGESFETRTVVYDVEITKVYKGVSIIQANNVQLTDYHCSKTFI